MTKNEILPDQGYNFKMEIEKQIMQIMCRIKTFKGTI